jgi:hypothetical protein
VTAAAAVGAGVGAPEKHVGVLGNVEVSILFNPMNPFRAVSTTKPASVSALIKGRAGAERKRKRKRKSREEEEERGQIGRTEIRGGIQYMSID